MAIINDGHATLVTFADFPDVSFKEKTVTPPGIEGGGPNDTSTMHNLIWRTRQPKKLKTLTEGSMTAAYDPVVYDDIVAMINENQLITVTFADGSTVTFWGWLDSFIPGEAEEGSQPTAEVKFVPSNQNDVGDEVAPVYAAA